MATNRYTGFVVDKATQVGAAGIRVEAYDLRQRVRGVIAAALSDAQGRFQLGVTDDVLSSLFADLAPVLYFVLSAGTNILASTEKTNRWNAKRSMSGRLEVNTLKPIGTGAGVVAKYIVEGIVADMEAGPVNGATVQVFARSVSGAAIVETPVGTTTSAASGRYRVSYDAPSVAPDIIVRATAGVAQTAEATICSAPVRATADILVKGQTNARYPGRSRFAVLFDRVDPIMRFATSPWTAAQIDLASCQARVSRDEVQALSDAMQLDAAQTDPLLSTEMFFGLMRQGVGRSNDDVFGHRLPVLQRLLENAAASRTISPGIMNATNLPLLMTALQTAARAALRVTTPGKLRLGALVDGAPGVSLAERDAFLNKSLNNEAGSEAFWAAVEVDAAFSVLARRRLRFAVEMGALTGSFLPMATALHARVAAATLTDDPKLLAKYEIADWDGLIAGTSFPSGTTAVAYRDTIMENIETRFRSARIRHRVGLEAASSALKKFLAAGVNASFEFERHRVGRYLIETPTALSTLTAPEQVDATKRLRDIERLWRVTASYAEVEGLVAAGITSSYAIHQMGRDKFVSSFTSLMTAPAANLAFDKACWRSSGAQAMQMKYSAKFTQAPLSVVNSSVSLVAAALPTPIGDWATLFGTLDQCACTHCRSVLGPAAYMVDVIELLERVPRTPSGNGKTEILARRPDLQHLALSCENAETPLPYIDVANEIMEVRLAASTWPSWPAAPNPIQVLATAAELKAQPEVLYPTQYVAAYNALEATIHPFNLPFHLYQEEARIYLDHLGVSRADLLLALPLGIVVNARHLAIERLRIAPRQYDIIAAPTLTPQAYWGLASWPATLLAKVVMEKAALDFDELRELLATEYCALPNNIKFSPTGTCDLSTLEVLGVTTMAHQHMLHRLLRLRLALGCSISDVDRARRAVGTLDATTLNRIAGIHAVSKQLNVPLVTALAWYADMDRWGKWEKSLFERVYLDKRVQAPAVAAFQTVFDSVGGTSGVLVSAVLTGLATALQLSDDDVRLLTDQPTLRAEAALLTPMLPSGSSVDLPGLSRVFRVTSFAKTLGKTLKDFIVLRQFSGLGVLAGDDVTATPDDTLAFVSMLTRFERTGLSVAETQYILRHFATPESGLEPTLEQEAAWETEILGEITKGSAEAAGIKDVTGETARSQALLLASQLGPPALPAAANILVDGLVRDPLGTATNSGVFITRMALFLGDTAEPTAKLLTGGGSLKERDERYAYLAQRFTRYLNVAGAIKSWVSRTFDIPIEIGELLLENGHLLWGTDKALRAYIPKTQDPVAADTWGAPPGTQVDRGAIIKRLHKVALLVNRLGLTALDIKNLYPGGIADPGGLPFLNLQTLLMVAPSAPANFSTERGLFATLLRLADLVWLRDRYSATPETLYATFAFAAGSTPTLILDRIALETRFGRKDTEDLATRFGATTAAAFRNEQAIYRVAQAIETLRRLGASALQAIGWLPVEAALPPTDLTEIPGGALAIARDIKRVARAKHDDAAWSTVGGPLRDPLRERQRQALVASLLPKLGVANSDQLYEKLLVDVDMTPCAITSRIVAAHGSLQTFTNRILLNLEPGLAPNKQLGEEWEWMRAYRVWEANRKVFLWPENWIEPELRDDKTPLFEDLETALLQGEITDKGAEAAYRAYLDGLADVANLEIVAIHTSETSVSQPLRSVHAIGRTKKPHRYFHRKRTSEGWTPWRKIDADIQGDHIIPVTLNGRLYLFWALLEEKERTEPLASMAAPPPPPNPDDVNDVEDTGFLIQDLVQEALHDKLAKQEADKAAQLAAQTPAPLALSVSFAVAELKDGTWTTSSNTSKTVELGASPFRPFLSFVARTSGQTIRAQMLCFTTSGFRSIASMRYDVGSTLFRTKLDTPIEPYNGGAAYSNILVQPNPDGTVKDVTRLNLQLEQQRFVVNKDKLQLYLVENGDIQGSAVVLNLATNGRLTASRGKEPAKERRHLVFQRDQRSFFMTLITRPYKVTITSEGAIILLENINPSGFADKNYRFELFYHPYVNDFRSRLAMQGIDGLLKPSSQVSPFPQYQFADIASSYLPQYENVELNFPQEVVDFTYGSAYGVYNWEIFFHAPLLIATRLSQEGRFDEARKWFHTIFDPTDGTAPPGVSLPNQASRYWKFRKFAENQDLASIQLALGEELTAWANGETQTPAVDHLIKQIAKWRRDPFDPHAIARLRIIAYQKTVVQKYVENLIAWGDQLFAQDSIESINEATQLYLLALQIMGPKPTLIPSPNPGPVQSYKQLDDPPLGSFDPFANALVETEAIVPDLPGDGFECRGGRMPPATITGSPYFCVPQNEKLFGFWDTLADRLFKIRHCQNIEGVVRALPLFQPPIDPGLLVRAKAAGLDLSSVLNDLSVAAPPYRYAILAARAAEYTGAVVGLGGALLSALEKKDAETLAQLRSTHEVANQESMRGIRKSQVAEARANLDSTTRSLRSAEERRDYYESREFMSPGETAAMALGQVSQGLNIAGQTLKTAGSQTSIAPDGLTGAAGIAAPVAIVLFGASNLAKASFGAGDAIELAARAVGEAASVAGTVAGYKRRQDDWEHQAKLAKLEIGQIEKQIVAAEIRLAVAEQELRLLEQQLKQSRDVERFLRTRYTNKDLYGWMVGQLSAVYYQSYKLAYEMARRAEKAFNFERADTQSFIKFGHWEGLRKGLLAGDRLALDLRRMDSAYHSQNKREYELTKTVSIADLDPDAFMSIREGVNLGGAFTLSETRFDEDFPTHHLRRIKSASISVHCAPGAYQAVNGRLTLLAAETRKGPSEIGVTAWTGAVSSTATSMAQNETGLFELNFRDERYLPFEGAGAHVAGSPPAVPQWRFELMAGNEFPYDSISDVVMQLRYTSREGRVAANLQVPAVPAFTNPRRTMWRVQHAFADAWQVLKEGGPELALVTTPASFPKARTRSLGSITEVKLYVRCGSSDNVGFSLANPGAATPGNPMQAGTPIGSGGTFVKTFVPNPGVNVGISGTQTWKFTPTTGTLALIQDLWVSFTYTLA